MSVDAVKIEDIILKRKKRFLKELRNSLIIILSLLVFRSSFFEPYRIPTGSMIPTLRIGDFILVNKLSYGLKVPFSDMAIFDLNLKPIYIYQNDGPKRGDVIVFKYPVDPSINYIKRVIGVPGDQIEIRDKVIYVNEEPVSVEEFDGREIFNDLDSKSKANNLKFFNSELGEHKFVVQQDQDNLYSNHLDKITIPEGKYFVMGDNRDYSYDSRFWGFVPKENIRGKALWVWFSMSLPNNNEVLEVKWHRIFTKID